MAARYDVPLSFVMSQYLTHRERIGRAANTLQADRSALKKLAAAVGNVRVSSITVENVEALLGDMLESRRYKRSTINTTQSGLSAFFKYCRKHEYAPPMWDPLDERTYFKAQPQAGLRIPADDFDRILDAAPFPRDRALMAVGLHTLLRQSEIITLRVGDLDLAKGELEVQIWKSDKADTLLISEDFGEELVRWLAAYTAQCGPLQPDWYLIPAQRNDGFSTYRIDGTRAISHSERIVRRVLEAAGFSNDRMGIHDLRRSGARAQWDEFAAVNEPNAIRFVSNQMHHSETSTTERYIGRDIDKIGLDNFRRNNPTYPSLVAKRAAAAAAQVPEEPVVGLRLVPPLPDEDDEGGVAAMTYGN